MESTLRAERGPVSATKWIIALALLITMLLPVILLAAKGDLPAPTSIQGFKDFVNALSVPELSLPFFFLPLFIGMFVFYQEWTDPRFIVPAAVLFTVVYFGSMAIDHNYYEILSKADNVPISMMIFGCGFFIWLAMRQGAINDQRMVAGLPLLEEDKDDKVLVWPDLVYTEMICIILGSVVLLVWSILLPAPLESPANPAGPPNPSKAPWYFLGLQEMLVYFDPWMAGVVLPGMIITGLIALPYIDTNPKGNGYYTLMQRKFAISTWMFGFLILWVVLIFFGTFLRGPNWNFFGPYEAWDAIFQPAATNIQLSDLFWNGANIKPLKIGLSGDLPGNMFVRELPGILFTIFWVLVLPVILARTIMRRLYTQMGAIRFYIMAVHLVIMAMMPLKMGLRWTLNLKYFVYLPELNLNL
jgi:hypothetical protein